jgi:tRNA-Thr(GGU) m(6)t(6)A37 methyltransferase TsaA
MSIDRLTEIKQQIEDLKQCWPAHSVPAALMEQLDELEEALRKEQEKSVIAVQQTVTLRPIGYVENEFNEPASPDEIRMIESRIILDSALIQGLQGLEPGQQIMVIFYFHRSEGYDLLQHPQGDRSRPKRGVFALRSPNRPNPIGVTVVELVGIEDNILRVLGLDAIQGTPVLDLKAA